SPSQGVSAKVIAGEVAGVRGPIRQPATDPTYLDLALEPRARFTATLPADYAAFLYVYEGALAVGREATPVQAHELAVLTEGDSRELTGPSAGADAPRARAILAAGRPRREPVAKYGPFVMNTRAELEQAFADYQSGRF